MIDFPFGFRSVGFKRSALEYVCKNKMSINTETGYRDFFYSISSFKHHKMFFDKKITCSSKIRLSLDYTEDLSLAEIIIKKLGNNFSLMEILELLPASQSASTLILLIWALEAGGEELNMLVIL